MTPTDPALPHRQALAAFLFVLVSLAVATPVAVCAQTAPTAPAAASDPAIPPGQEALLEAALTPGADWPPGWHLLGAAIAKTSIVVKYRHDGGAAAQVTLAHPDVLPALLKTKAFALAASAGQPPPPDAVTQALARSLDAMVGWRWVAAATLPSPGAPPQPTTPDAGPGGSLLSKARTAAAAGHAAQAGGFAREALAAVGSLTPLDRILVQLEAAWVLRQAGDPQARPLFEQVHAAAATLPAQATAADATGVAGAGASRPFVQGSALLGLDRTAAFAALTAGQPRIDCATVNHWARGFASTGQVTGLDALESLLARRPPCTEAAVTLAGATATLGLPERGERLLRELLADPVAATDQAKAERAQLQLTLVQLLRQQERCPDALAAMAAIDIRALPHVEQRLSDISRLYIDCHDPVSLARFQAQSDADPKDGIAAFLAGAVLHHEHKWQPSEPYLQRSAALMQDQPRQFLYQAMNAHHLGDQVRAVALIARASSVGASDPDVQYCRAVILGDTQPVQAIADLRSYQAATARSRDNNARKAVLVAAMLDDLEACKAARDVGECRRLQHGLRTAKQVVPVVLGAVGLVALAGVLWWRRRRRP